MAQKLEQRMGGFVIVMKISSFSVNHPTTKCCGIHLKGTMLLRLKEKYKCRTYAYIRDLLLYKQCLQNPSKSHSK